MKTNTTPRTLYLVLILIISLASCITQKQRAKICSTCPVKTETEDSIIYKLKDTTVYLSMPGPVQYIESPCDSLGNLKPINKTEKKNGIKTTIKTVGNIIVFNSEADSLKAIIKGLKEKESYSKQTVFVDRITGNERTRFDGFTFWCFWFTMAYFLIFFAIRYIRKNTRI